VPAASGGVAAPPPPQAAPLLKPGEPCWFWRGAESSTAALRDPSALPVDGRQHELRVRRNLWGPRWARLCPGRVLGVKGKWATVDDLESKRQEKVPASMLLPQYEGLLVLDAVSKMEPKVPWLTDKLVTVLESERAKYKHFLSAHLYYTNKLHNIAVTGPNFFGASGSAISHRRQLQARGAPGEGEASEGWFAVQGLADYLPPWEAFLHPKCGIYQEFYMVQWGAPHNKTDYAYVEHGCDTQAGATWEPDECLPEDLDSLRVGVKRRWAEQQKEREGREREVLERERREREAKAKEGGEDGERPAKAPRLYNPMRLDLLKDVASPEVGHGVHNLLRSTEDSEIKKGWPKSQEEYPPGFGPAEPPGCCGALCDCMEDWHLGRKSLDAGRPWVDTQIRSTACDAAVLTFTTTQKEHVARRGLVSGMHFLEAATDRHKREDITQVAFAAGFSKFLLGTLREAAQRIPLEALLTDAEGPRPGCLIRMLAAGFASEEIHPEAGGPFIPLQYEAATPSFLHVNAGTGAVSLCGEKPDASTGQVIPLSFKLGSMFGKFDSRMDCRIDINAPESGDPMLHSLTSKVVAKVPRLEPPGLLEVVKERLSPIYSFEASACLEGSFSEWVEAVWSASLVTRAVSVSQLVLRSPPAPRQNGHMS